MCEVTSVKRLVISETWSATFSIKSFDFAILN